MEMAAAPALPHPTRPALATPWAAADDLPPRQAALPAAGGRTSHGQRSQASLVAAALAALPVGARRSRRRISRQRRRAAAQATSAPDFQVKRVRRDFPALRQQVRPGVPLVYLDNAATSQKPASVLAELERFYSEDNSNVHRGMHTLSIRSTEAFEGARMKVADFVGAKDSTEIIFTRNATEAINLVARSWGAANIKAGDEILLTVMEHHSNLVPWQQLAEISGAKLNFVGITEEGRLDRAEFERLLSERTKLVSMCHVSNVLGCLNPVEWVAEKAHAVGAKVLVDACQSVPHMCVDVQKLGVDWLVASSHKMCGPTGIGFLWGQAELLRASPPFLGGGEMIDEVSLDGSTYADIPHKLEAGTPAFAEAVALGAACDYLSSLGMEKIAQQEHFLTEHLWKRVAELPGVELYGPTPAQDPERAALACFNVAGCHANDLATLADQDRGIAMRAGHHCAQPLHKKLGVTASARLSAYFYNTTEEIDLAVAALKEAINILQGDTGGMDLFSMTDEASAQPAECHEACQDPARPATVQEALKERGLLGRTSWTAEQESPLAKLEVPTTVCAAFELSTGSLTLRDLPKLVFLRWCQLYGHTPVCLISSSLARSGCGPVVSNQSAEDLEHHAFCLCTSLERAFEGMGATAVVVDDAEFLGKMSVVDCLRDLGPEVPLEPLLRSAGWSPGDSSCLADVAAPLLQGKAFSEVRALHGVAVQAGMEVDWTALSLGDSQDAPQGFLSLVPLPVDLLSTEELPTTPAELFGMVRSLPDESTTELFRRLTCLPLGEIEAISRSADGSFKGLWDAKDRLAEEVTRLVFGDVAFERPAVPEDVQLRLSQEA